MRIVIEYQDDIPSSSEMANLNVLEDRGREVELGHPKGRRTVAKLGATGFGLLSLILITSGPRGFGIVFFAAPLVLWLWKLLDDRRTIRFNQPPGYITVDYYRWSILGAWSFFKDQKRLPLSEAGRRRSDITRGLMQTSPMGTMSWKSYKIFLPDGSGNSFKLWEGDDREVQYFLEQKIQEAIQEWEGAPGQPGAA